MFFAFQNILQRLFIVIIFIQLTVADYSCNFENGLCAEWSQSSTDDFNWTLHSGSTASSSTGPSSGHGGYGYYMFIETSFPRRKGDNATLELVLPGNGGHGCLSFYYHMYGADVGTLNVFSGNMKVFNESGNKGNIWRKAERTIVLGHKLVFEGIRGSSFRGDLAIDDVLITNGKCLIPRVSCNFDSGLCYGWHQSHFSDVFDWTRGTGGTPSSNTGPSYDHTTGSGYYMFIETSYPRKVGDNAKLELVIPGNGELGCLSFYYHMYGADMGTLNVFSGNMKVFNECGNQRNIWRKAKRTIVLGYNITFEGIRGASFTSDIAIDDVSLTDGICSACRLSVNLSVGLIDVAPASDYDPLDCSWTIGKVGITNAVALFIIQRISLSSCSEHFKIFDGKKTLEYQQTGDTFIDDEQMVEVPFLSSDEITVNISLTRLGSSVKAQYVILESGLLSAPNFPGWKCRIVNKTPSSISVQWTDLTVLLNRQVRHFLVFLKLNEHNGSYSAHQFVNGSELGTEITGLIASSIYTVVVFGIDKMGKPYKTTDVQTRTMNATCGMRPTSSTLIVGGTVAPINDWPWQAMLRSTSGRQFCGGSLIRPEWVLTAAHCIKGKSPSNIEVTLGAHYISRDTVVGTEQYFDVVQIIQHENYSHPSFPNDVALLRLSKPAKLRNEVGLVCLSDDKFQLPFDDEDEKCWITGWGTLYYYGPQPKELMQVEIPLVSRENCSYSYPGLVDDSMICVGRSQGGIGACHGDSGGPLVCEFNGKWYLEGVSSWTGLPCGTAGKPTVYANVRYLKSWIMNNMNNAPLPGLVTRDATLLPYTPLRSSTTQRPSTAPAPNCGFVQNDTLRSPGYPNYYPNNMDCVYRVSIPHGKDLIIYFNDFNLESHSNCAYDYLRITNDSNDIIGVFCGLQIGNWVRVTGNFAEITFHSDRIIQRTGYELFFSYSGYPVSCNFDSGLCYGWNQSQLSDVFNWTRGTGGTPSLNTGPSSDHTTGSGYYMFIETSSPRQEGDNAKLELVLPGNGELGCLFFYYHMYGTDMGTLNVFSGNMKVFNESGNQGNIWRKAERTIVLGHKLTFEGIRGSSFRGDLAIDDVLITNGSCLIPRGNTILRRYATQGPTTTRRPRLDKGEAPPPPPPAPEPKQPSEEERIESVNIDIQGLNTSEWNKPKEDAFKQSVAEAATIHCANDSSCISSSSKRKRRSLNNLIFTEDQVHLLPGYPKQVSQVPLVAIAAFYLQTLPGSSSSVIDKNVLVAIVKSSVAEISSALNANISNVQQLFDSTTTTAQISELASAATTSPTTTVPAEEEVPNTILYAIIVGVVGALVFVIVVSWLCRGKKRERSRRGEEKNDALGLEMSHVKRTGDIGYYNDTYALPPKVHPERQ